MKTLNLTKPVDVSILARVCHEANKAWCEATGDNTQLSWDLCPAWQQESCIKGVQFHLDRLSKGEDELQPQDSHNAWLEHKKAEGWTWGPVKDAKKKEHPSFMEYESLPFDQKIKDYIFSGIVKAVYEGCATLIKLGSDD